MAIKKYRPRPGSKSTMRVDAGAIDMKTAKPKYDAGSKKRQTPDRKPTYKYEDKGGKNVGMAKKRMKHGKAGGRKTTKYRKGVQTQGKKTANTTKYPGMGS
tara:strand:- start:90 stop:392 length:303 start_codon:yes stop_codon:yes gene_type:complete